MSKQLLKRVARSAGLYLASSGRLGIDLDLDLARLTVAKPIKTIFDVGGNYGQTAVRMATAYPAARVSTFEPVPSAYEKLLAAVKPFDRIKPFNVAVGEAPGTVQINISSNPLENSIRQVGTSTGSVEVRVDTLDASAERDGIATIDLLKIDVEGYEIPVLKGAQRLLREGRIRFIYAECTMRPNPETPHTSFFEMHALLERAGFCFVTYYAENFKLRQGCAIGNVLWALRSTLPESAPGSVHNIA